MTKDIVQANEVVGENVENPQGESLGKVEAIMLDKLNGHVEYVVLSYGGFLGMGDKYFALPWSIFSYDENKNCFVVNINQEKLKNSPGFDKDHWPNMADERWSRQIHDYYGTRAGRV